MMKKKSFLTLIIGNNLTIWILQTIIAGMVMATSSFFTKEGWEKWKNRKKVD